jgi:hypothetical protein
VKNICQGWAGENVARSWDHPSHPLVKAVGSHSLRPCLGEGASLGEEAVLADSGRAGEVAARVGRVRSLAFLSILREGSSVVLRVQIIEVLAFRNSFSAAC